MSGKNDWKLEWKGKEFNSKLDMDIPTTMDVIGHYLVAKLRETLNQQGHGRIYRTGRSGGTHQASAPGEPPAPWTGDLRNTTFFETGYEQQEFFTKVGSPMPYAARLEFGDSHIAKRPWLGVTLRNERKAIEKFLQSGIFK
jgi:hypothetical protein